MDRSINWNGDAMVQIWDISYGKSIEEPGRTSNENQTKFSFSKVFSWENTK